MGNKIYIYGANGFGREVLNLFREIHNIDEKELKQYVSFVDDNRDICGTQISGIDVCSIDEADIEKGEFIVAIASPVIRQMIVDKLPKKTKYKTLIHPSANVGMNVKIGDGAIICAGSILTCDINIGTHCHLNLNTTIGHDCKIGNYFTTAPAVNISGNCIIGERVYFGTKSATRQGNTIASDVLVGMSANVIKDLSVRGNYIGTPAKLMEPR